MTFPPHGLAELVATYGDAREYVDAPITWEKLILFPVPVPPGLLLYAGAHPVTSLRCHRLAVPAYKQAISGLIAAGLSGVEYGGTYCFRVNRRNPKRLSTHAWGIASDFNESRCPMGCDPALQDQRIVRAFKDAGFTWLLSDPMHLQLATGV